MKIPTIILLLILLTIVTSQRGGGRSRSGGSSSRSYYSRPTYISGPSYVYGPTVYSPVSIWVPIITVLMLLSCCACIACAVCCSAARQANYYEEQIKVRNIVSTTYMSEEMFEIERQQFMNGQWMFKYRQGLMTMDTPVYNLQMRKQGPFEYSFTMAGTDSWGTWTSRGFYFVGLNGIQFWMLKDYDDKDAAGQTDQFQYLIYEGA